MAQNESDIIASLQSTLQESIDAGVPELSAEVRSSQGTTWQTPAGLVDVEAQQPVDTNHLFGIGSITKVFISVVVLQLVAEKNLRLQDTVGSILTPRDRARH
jgi:D-alanyl-D-alanine carboxypeptidase